jgi:hypothetical protein
MNEQLDRFDRYSFGAIICTRSTTKQPDNRLFRALFNYMSGLEIRQMYRCRRPSSANASIIPSGVFCDRLDVQASKDEGMKLLKSCDDIGQPMPSSRR